MTIALKILSSAVGPDGMAGLAILVILLVTYCARHKMDARRSFRSGADCPWAGITNQYNAHNMHNTYNIFQTRSPDDPQFTHSGKTARRRRGRSARRRSLR